MVIGETFVWAHFPKAAGDATLGLFRMFPEVIVSADDTASPAKHTRFPEVADRIGDKLLVMNIRPLPAWLLSFAHQMAKQTGRDQSQATIKEIMAAVQPDGKLKAFCGDGRFRIDRWIHTERLADDFLAFISTVTDVSPRARKKVRRGQRRNEQRYDRDWDTWFTSADLERLYVQNPFWATIERDAGVAPH
jgi:hypothetical protein